MKDSFIEVEEQHPTPGQPNQPTAAEINGCEAFADRLLAEYDAQMYECVAEAANEFPADVVSKDDIRRLGPFINSMMVRLFALGVGAGVADMAKQARARATTGGSPTVTLQ